MILALLCLVPMVVAYEGQTGHPFLDAVRLSVVHCVRVIVDILIVKDDIALVL
jgi:hypothetical protein